MCTLANAPKNLFPIFSHPSEIGNFHLGQQKRSGNAQTVSTKGLTRKDDDALLVPDSFTEPYGRSRLVKFRCTRAANVSTLLDILLRG